MSYYKQPGHATGSYDVGHVTASCPLDGLPGRPIGSSSFRFRDDNGHYFDFGSQSILTAATPKATTIREEPGAKNFVDDVTGLATRP